MERHKFWEFVVAQKASVVYNSLYINNHTEQKKGGFCDGEIIDWP